MITHPVLSCYYAHVASLGDYIVQTHTDQAIDLTSTSAEYDRFLTQTAVAWNDDAKQASFRPAEITESLDDVLRRVQLELLRRDAKDANVLCLGYRLVRLVL